MGTQVRFFILCCFLLIGFMDDVSNCFFASIICSDYYFNNPNGNAPLAPLPDPYQNRPFTPLDPSNGQSNS